MSDLPSVCVLLLNYCSLDESRQCLETIRRIEYPNTRLLLIDNASPDESGGVLKELVEPAEFLKLPRNTGYAGGNNAGIRVAMAQNARYVFVVNPDVRVLPESVGTYVSVLESNATIGALNPIQVGADGRTIDRRFRQGILEPRGFQNRTCETHLFPEWFEVDTLYGAALIIRTATVEAIGGFDPLYFAYGEEVDWCRRARYHGFRLAVTGRAPVRHLRTNEVRGVDDFGLFLRLKACYLYRLKDPQGSFLLGLKTAFEDLSWGLVGRPRAQFPFNEFSVTRKQMIRTALWLAVHAIRARRHRERERGGRMYV